MLKHTVWHDQLKHKCYACTLRWRKTRQAAHGVLQFSSKAKKLSKAVQSSSYCSSTNVTECKLFNFVWYEALKQRAAVDRSVAIFAPFWKLRELMRTCIIYRKNDETKEHASVFLHCRLCGSSVEDWAKVFGGRVERPDIVCVFSPQCKPWDRLSHWLLEWSRICYSFLAACKGQGFVSVLLFVHAVVCCGKAIFWTFYNAMVPASQWSCVLGAGTCAHEFCRYASVFNKQHMN